MKVVEVGAAEAGLRAVEAPLRVSRRVLSITESRVCPAGTAPGVWIKAPQRFNQRRKTAYRIVPNRVNFL